MTKTVLVFGGGQLAFELARSVPENIEHVQLSRQDCDICDAEAVAQALKRYRPKAVINAAAYTAVDKAETEVKDAYAVNANGPKNLASACAQVSAKLVHVSTDFVFDGESHRPYGIDAVKNPVSVYGQSKADGEDAIAATDNCEWAIVRTAWVYSSHGNNFVKTMLRLMAEKPVLNVVGDQIGTPTWAYGLAQACWKLALSPVSGILHWTDAGVASWYDFAVAIQRLGCEKGLLKRAIPVHPIATEDYPTPAKRPSFSVLDKRESWLQLATKGVHWQEQLASMLDELAAEKAGIS